MKFFTRMFLCLNMFGLLFVGTTNSVLAAEEVTGIDFQQLPHSAHYSLIEPGRKGEDSLEVLSATADGARVHVALEDMRVAHQLALSYDLGDGLTGEVLFTVNEVPAPGAGR